MAAVTLLKHPSATPGIPTALDGTADDVRINSVGVGDAPNGTRGTLNFGTTSRTATIQLNNGTGNLDFSGALGFTFTNTVRADSDNLRDLGATGTRWATSYVTTLDAATAVVIGAAGTAASPSLRVGEATSGLYRAAASIVGVAGGGLDIARFDGSAGLRRIYSDELIITTLLGGAISGRTDASALTIRGGGDGTLQGLVFNTSANHTATSGAQIGARFNYTFAPTSGSATFYGHNLDLTINQTGGANGNYSAIRANVTETAAGGSANRLLSLLVGGADRAAISSVGSLALGNVAPSTTAGRLSIKGGGGGTDALIEAVDATGAAGLTIKPRITASGSGTTVFIEGGNADTTGSGGGVTLKSGTPAGGGAEGTIAITKSDGSSQYLACSVQGSNTNVSIGQSVTQLNCSSAFLTGGTTTGNNAAVTESPPASTAVLVRELAFKIAYNFFTAAATEETKTFCTLPANAVVDDVWWEHVTNFAGTGFTAYTIEIGRSGGTTTEYYAAQDVFANPRLIGDAASEKAAALTDGRTRIYSTSGTTALQLTARSTGGNLSAATAGRVNIWVRYHVVPAPPA